MSIFRYSVVMCTYNGASYVTEQLNSILNQTLSPAEIIISDDGSTDETYEILRNIARINPKITLLPQGGRRGINKNFEYVLSQATGDFVFLSDQDDVWEVDKIKIFSDKIEHEKINPKDIVLIFSDLLVVNSSLQIAHDSFWSSAGLNVFSYMPSKYLPLIMENVVTGCASVVSSGLIKVALPFPDKIAMHDHWLALVANFMGSILSIPKPLVKYRQHGANAVGATGSNIFVNARHFRLRYIRSLSLFNVKINQLRGLIALLEEKKACSREELIFLKKINNALAERGILHFLYLLRIKIFPRKFYIRMLYFLLMVFKPRVIKESGHENNTF